VKTGSVIGACTRRHRSEEFRAFLDQVEASAPADLDVHLVLDNASTHKTRLVHDWLEHFQQKWITVLREKTL
jgi:hypothetical protein